MVSTLCDIHDITNDEVLLFVFFNNEQNIVLLKEIVLPIEYMPKNKKTYIKMYATFKFNSFNLKGGEEYALQYILSGRILATRKIRFEDGTYSFSKFPKKYYNSKERR